MTLLFQGKVEVLEESEREIRTVRFTLKIPSVLRLLQYVPIKKKKPMVRFSRNNVFSRDRFTCQYCGIRFNRNHLTLDHVIPIVQGGKKSWDNIVTSCKACNQQKGGRTPAQAGMKFMQKPQYPSWLPLTTITLGVSQVHEKWKVYLKIESVPPDPEPGSDRNEKK